MRLFLLARLREVIRHHRASARVPPLIRLIAAGKILKGVGFILAALVLARWSQAGDLGSVVLGWIQAFHFDPDGERAQHLLAWCTGVPPGHLRLIAAGIFTYAALYLIEGIGLWFDRPWAEWLVVIGTCLLIPVEAEHLIAKPSVWVAIVLVINAAVAVFLVRRIRQRRVMAGGTGGTTPPAPSAP